MKPAGFNPELFAELIDDGTAGAAWLETLFRRPVAEGHVERGVTALVDSVDRVFERAGFQTPVGVEE